MSTSEIRKSILFISSVDFKEKSIQVIRKTPEAYIKDGWDVHYVVGRDNSKHGNYFYERQIELDGVKTTRFQLPFAKCNDLISYPLWQAIWFRIRNMIYVYQLIYHSRKKLTSQNFDVVYGYEVLGVLALRFLKWIGATGKSKLVTRFQGVLYVKEWLREGKRFRLITNYSTILALKTKADLCIMTNDGSQGLTVLKTLNSPNENILFCPNGVDEIETVESIGKNIAECYPNDGKLNFVSVSRLDPHKRIDRGIRIVNALIKELGINNLRFTIIGGGSEAQNLANLVNELGITDYVRFVGPVRFSEVNGHYQRNDVFLSMYTSTNVGNPLLEAIRNNLLIVTLNNGDTGDWIKHFNNGLIYDIDDQLDLNGAAYSKIASDILSVLNDSKTLNSIKENLQITEKNKLWTWDERFSAEIAAVKKLLN